MTSLHNFFKIVDKNFDEGVEIAAHEQPDVAEE
jgi:hypothetical protein